MKDFLQTVIFNIFMGCLIAFAWTAENWDEFVDEVKEAWKSL